MAKIVDREELMKHISGMERPLLKINSSPAVRVPVREIEKVIGLYGSSPVYVLPAAGIVLLVVDSTLRKWIAEKICTSLNDSRILSDDYTEDSAILDACSNFGHVQRHLLYVYTEAHDCTAEHLSDVCELIRKKGQK